MFSATDPVAVVTVLREAGLSKRLRTLVDLEALLNDGTAYVLFFVLRRFVVDASNAAAGQATGTEPTTVSTALVFFVRLAVGGAALGLAFGVATTAWLRYMYNAPMPEITITFVSTFLTYLVGDRLLGVSGVVSFKKSSSKTKLLKFLSFFISFERSGGGAKKLFYCFSPSSGATAERRSFSSVVPFSSFSSFSFSCLFFLLVIRKTSPLSRLPLFFFLPPPPPRQ